VTELAEVPQFRSGGCNNRAPARAHASRLGLTDDDSPSRSSHRQHLDRNRPLQLPPSELAEPRSGGRIRAAGGTPLEFNTVSISDGITMGHRRHARSLISPKVIADSIELVSRGNLFAALSSWSAAIKRFRRHYGPGPLNIPGTGSYAAPLRPAIEGHSGDRFRMFTKPWGTRRGKITDKQLKELECFVAWRGRPAAGSSPPNTHGSGSEFLEMLPWAPPAFPHGQGQSASRRTRRQVGHGIFFAKTSRPLKLSPRRP